MRRLRFAIVLLALFAGTTFWLTRQRLAGGLRIDEAHKLADTWFFHLLVNRDFSNPDWLRHIVDRSNPALPKFLWGASIRAQGQELPQDLSIRTEEPDGSLGQELTVGAESRYHPSLLAARKVSIFATALTGCILFVIARRARGPLAAIIAFLLFVTSFLTAALGATLIADPLLTLFIASTALPLVAIVNSKARSRLIMHSIILGILCACAVQTRVTGLVALGASVAALLFEAVRVRRARFLSAALIAIFATAFVSTALNPYYWVGVAPDPQIPPTLTRQENLVARTFHRYEQQFADLRELLARQKRVQPELEGVAKLRYANEILGGDVPGIALILGFAAAILLAVFRPGDTLSRDGVVWVWAGTILLMLLLWLPFAWPRYLLAAIPPLAFLAGIGWADLAKALVAAVRGRPGRVSEPADG